MHRRRGGVNLTSAGRHYKGRSARHRRIPASRSARRWRAKLEREWLRSWCSAG